MSDLVRKLRHEAWHTSYKPSKPWDLLVEAADELERLTRELEEARKDAGWQPIETAPRDGTRVLCVWACAWGEMVYEGWCQSAGTARDGGDFWRSHSLVPVSGRPTHWMPLPPPPQEK